MLKFIVIVIAAIVFGYYAYITFDDAFKADRDRAIDKPMACAADAKLCADGSAVGRSGPNCEFAACPQE